MTESWSVPSLAAVSRPSLTVRPQPALGLREAPDPALDGLRGVAILLVFVFHYGGGLRAGNPLVRAFGYLTQIGWVGVELFFALSGFLITGILIRNLHTPHALPSFYARRALRILPLYFAAVFACGVAALVTGATLTALKPLLIYAAFLQNLPPLVNAALHTPPPLPLHHLWSLAVEEQFYLVWPIALLAARTPHRQFRLCLATFALSCLCRFVLFAPHSLPYATAQSFAVFLPVRAGALALGGALAVHLRSLPHPHTSIRPAGEPVLPAVPLQTSTTAPSEAKEVPAGSTAATRGGRKTLIAPGPRAANTGSPVTRTLLLLSLIALLTILLTGRHTRSLLLNNPASFMFTLPAVDLLSIVLVALSLRPNLFRRFCAVPALCFLGRISYGIYVLHILLQPLFDHLGFLLTHATAGFPYQTARLLTAFPITVAAAWISFTVFESPFLRLKDRFPQKALPLAGSYTSHA